MAFKKAVAAAAMTKLLEGAYSKDYAAFYVITQLGDMVFPSEITREAAEALKEFHGKILAIKAVKGKEESVARFHYHECLKQINGYRFDPKFSADTLIKTLRLGQ
ncbi:MAG: hypothetical protein A3G18_12945 [Rhodospirillales bacterium RIFCSPLOWO2_12_FULL_58_28]|nr:MAG: hypothetical protein A3H92_12800 [Rhodospirillales bacterium RIFCSPLOWO2_02_FULL_58_16]OHC78491.1 MAG: hypothetical protein A3G18_12945 [Rhodospirillales bacterium RIFCSPLOWO2_12_FULL_58_28]